LLEVHNERELRRAIRTDADVIGVNNRNLATLEIDLDTTTRLLGKTTAHSDRMIISESGIETSADILKLKHVVNGFLIGTSLMLSEDVESKVREFVLA
jgi:indole-3-glycerol phosphate synthase